MPEDVETEDPPVIEDQQEPDNGGQPQQPPNGGQQPSSLKDEDKQKSIEAQAASNLEVAKNRKAAEPTVCRPATAVAVTLVIGVVPRTVLPSLNVIEPVGRALESSVAGRRCSR